MTSWSACRGDLVEQSEVAVDTADFDAVWASRTPREQSRVIHLLVERVAYVGASGSVSITFKSTLRFKAATKRSLNLQREDRKKLSSRITKNPRGAAPQHRVRVLSLRETVSQTCNCLANWAS